MYDKKIANRILGKALGKVKRKELRTAKVILHRKAGRQGTYHR